jgi:hypothetical protein
MNLALVSLQYHIFIIMLENYITYKDNFLEKNYFEYIQSVILGTYFPWYFNDSRDYPGDNKYQFTHTFYKDNTIYSNQFKILDKFLISINAKAIHRIKVNLTLPTKTIENNIFHADTNFSCKTGILYLNTNNGKTLFENFEVSSVENRFVNFPTEIKHTGTTHTDVNKRIVLNINYY